MIRAGHRAGEVPKVAIAGQNGTRRGASAKSGRSGFGGVRFRYEHRRVSATYVVLVIGAEVAANLLVAGMFVARVRAPRHEGRWHCRIHGVCRGGGAVDLVLGLDVRRTRWLWAYLASFYLARSGP